LQGQKPIQPQQMKGGSEHILSEQLPVYKPIICWKGNEITVEAD
jgi:hypothetical protein